MELHLLLGVVNYLFKNLLQCWLEARDWLAKLKIQMQPFHGGQFTGNECSKMLQKLTSLKEWLKSLAPFKFKGSLKLSGSSETLSIHVLYKLWMTVSSKKPEHFKQSYSQLHITVTHKAHVIFSTYQISSNIKNL